MSELLCGLGDRASESRSENRVFLFALSSTQRRRNRAHCILTTRLCSGSGHDGQQVKKMSQLSAILLLLGAGIRNVVKHKSTLTRGPLRKF